MPYAQTEVLVVEDEVLIRMNTCDELLDLGFQVHEARDAQEALVQLGLHPGIRVLFTDIDMPGGSDGLQLARMVRDRWPSIGIIITSGRLRHGNADLPAVARFIPKPYDPARVAVAAEELMRA